MVCDNFLVETQRLMAETSLFEEKQQNKNKCPNYGKIIPLIEFLESERCLPWQLRTVNAPMIDYTHDPESFERKQIAVLFWLTYIINI